MAIHPYQLPQDIYDTSLKIISNVDFTRREIDIIACLLSGRTAKTIATLLSIAPRTVEAHTRNITLKLERNSREGIRDFIEKSNKLSIIRDYYDSLLAQYAFEKYLHIIARNKLNLTCHIVYRHHKGKNRLSLIAQIEEHLKIAGIKPLLEARENFHDIFHPNHHMEHQSSDCKIYIVDEAFLRERQDSIPHRKEVPSSLSPGVSHPGSLLFLLLPRESTTEIPEEISDADTIDCNAQESYYTLFFEVLKKILPLGELDAIIADFKREHNNRIGSGGNNAPPPLKPEENAFSSPREEPEKAEDTKPVKTHLLLHLLKKPKWILGGVGVLSLASILVLSQIGISPQSTSKHTGAQFLRPGLPIPALLNRHKLIEEIDKKLKKSGEIQTIALIGMGGAGKTTLARQYAHAQKSSIIWEINAETNNSLINSFEALASALCQTDEEKKVLTSLKDISNFAEKEEKIIQLVKNQLKAHPNWFLLYDNVERFSDIQKYFPSDANFWGKGKIIMTTQDSHIQNNSHVKDSVWIGELEPDEKLSLFMKIMNLGGKEFVDLAKQESTRKFLEKIPSFPLDVSIAAYYIKATSISYEKYLDYLNASLPDFQSIQENILKEVGQYTKTRYSIITLSLKHLMAAHKDFRELLLLLSLLDSKNIPRDLLDLYKGRLVVDNFIYHLKKYSLIANPVSQPTVPLSHISIHRSTRDIGFAYLSEFLRLNKDSPLLEAIACVLDDYLDQAIEAEDFPKMQVMAGHLEKFLDSSLSDFSKGLLESKLGCLYYFLNADKSYQIIENGLGTLRIKNLNHLPSDRNERIARSFLHIGSVYTELRLYKKAQELLEEVVNIYGKRGLNNDIQLSWALSHLGNVYRRLGNYEKARDCLEESIRLNKQHRADNKRLGRTLSYLGSVYRGLGFYQKSIETLEESLTICKKYYSKDHIRVGKALKSLGTVYRKLGDYKKAKEYIEGSILIFKKYFPENHINIGLALAYLGNCLRELGEYQKSRDCLEQSLKIHQKHFDENHAVTGWILFHLARTYKDLGRYQESQALFDKVLKIYDKKCRGENIETARSLRYMAEIYFEKNRLNDAESFIKRSLSILEHCNHIDAYSSREILGEIYLKKSIQLSPTQNNQQDSQNFKNQAIDQFNQALKIAGHYLPKNSAHIQRIHSKIKSLQEGRL